MRTRLSKTRPPGEMIISLITYRVIGHARTHALTVDFGCGVIRCPAIVCVFADVEWPPPHVTRIRVIMYDCVGVRVRVCVFVIVEPAVACERDAGLLYVSCVRCRGALMAKDERPAHMYLCMRKCFLSCCRLCRHRRRRQRNASAI